MSSDTTSGPEQGDRPATPTIEPQPALVEALPVETPESPPNAPARSDGRPNGLLARNRDVPPSLFMELLARGDTLTDEDLQQQVDVFWADKPGRRPPPRAAGPTTDP